MFTIPPDASALDIMRSIDSWADSSHGSDEAEKLWVLLTALRGPDSGDEALKDVTTALIRGAVCHKLASRGGGIYSMYNLRERLSAYADRAGKLTYLDYTPQTFIDYLCSQHEGLQAEAISPHFINHILRAARIIVATQET